MNLCKFVALVCVSIACSPSQDKAAPDPLEEVKRSFDVMAARYDSVRIVDADSSYSYFFLPKTDSVDMASTLYGEYVIEKFSTLVGDLNGDGLDEAVVKYSFRPYLQNNTLAYYKVLMLKDDRLEEIGEIFAGAHCEGPKLSLVGIRSGRLRFQAKIYAEGDPCCCPSLEESHQYKIENQKIVKI